MPLSCYILLHKVISCEAGTTTGVEALRPFIGSIWWEAGVFVCICPSNVEILQKNQQTFRRVLRNQTCKKKYERTNMIWATLVSKRRDRNFTQLFLLVCILDWKSYRITRIFVLSSTCKTWHDLTCHIMSCMTAHDIHSVGSRWSLFTLDDLVFP